MPTYIDGMPPPPQIGTLRTDNVTFWLSVQCTMCSLYTAIALWSKPETQNPLSQSWKNYFLGSSKMTFSFQLKSWDKYLWMVYQDTNLDMSQLVWLEGKHTDKEQIVQCIPLLCGIVLPMDLIDMIGFINFCVSLHHWLHRLWGKIRRKKDRKDNV